MNMFISISFYLLFVWMPSYLLVFHQLATSTAYFSSSFGLLILILTTMTIGHFAKNGYRKIFILIGIISIMLISFPLFKLIHQQSLALILFAQLCFALALGCIDGVINAFMGNTFPDKIRFIGISISYTLATAIFGGLAPTICSILIYKTGSDISPIIFLISSGAIAFISLLSLS